MADKAYPMIFEEIQKLEKRLKDECGLTELESYVLIKEILENRFIDRIINGLVHK